MGKLAQHLHVGIRGTLSVVLEQTTLLPGDAIVGIVRLHLTKPIERAELNVCLHGEQKLRWNTQSGDHKTPHWMSLDHLHQTVALTPKDSTFAEGEHMYRITFQLPPSLAPSLNYSRRRIGSLEDVRVTVAYTVEATLVVDAYTTANLRFSVPFVIPLSVPREAPVPKPIAVQQDGAVNWLGLLKRGTCHVELQVASDILDATSTIEAHVVLRLDTSRKLQYVILALYEDATIDRQRQRRLKRGSRIVGRRRFDAASLGTSSPLETTLRLPITPNDIYKFDPLLPTLQTDVLTLEYNVGVECHFGMGSTITATVPVRVVTVDQTIIPVPAA